jgi:peptidoglycan/LPS O-acetylase OafA/YrhL
MSVGAILGPILVLLFFDDAYQAIPILMLGISFAFIGVFDATVFGVLLTVPARRLGNISYGIYLLQGPVFFLTFAFAPIRSLAPSSPLVHWAGVIIVATVLVLIATATHVLIERPGIKAGQMIWALISGQLKAKKAQPA